MPNTRKDTQNTHRSPHQATTSTPRKIEASRWTRSCVCCGVGIINPLKSESTVAGATQLMT